MKFFEKRGDALGYDRCPITGDSLYRGLALVLYSVAEDNTKDGLVVSSSAVRTLAREEVAQRAYDHLISEGNVTPGDLSVEQILELNPKYIILKESLLVRMCDKFRALGMIANS